MEVPNLLDFVETSLSCEALRRRWIAAFCPHLPPSLKSLEYKPVLWAVFSSGRVPCLQGADACAAFDQVRKGRLLAFYEYDGDEENALLLPDGSSLRAQDLADENDIYLMAEDGSFTFVFTHEDGYGPYFCERRAE